VIVCAEQIPETTALSVFAPVIIFIKSKNSDARQISVTRLINAETAEVRTGLGFRDSREVILRAPCISFVPLCSWQLHFYSGIVEGKPEFSTDLVVLGILLKHVTG
jgi:hypothetical protein